jgi:hypothetical protein
MTTARPIPASAASVTAARTWAAAREDHAGVGVGGLDALGDAAEDRDLPVIGNVQWVLVTVGLFLSPPGRERHRLISIR